MYKKKRKIIWGAIGVWAIFAAFLFYIDNLFGRRYGQNYYPNRHWLFIFAVIGAGLILGIILCFTLFDDTNKKLGKLGEAELQRLNQQVENKDLYKNIATATDLFLILNYNGFWLKLIPITEVKQIDVLKGRVRGGVYTHLSVQTGEKTIHIHAPGFSKNKLENLRQSIEKSQIK